MASIKIELLVKGIQKYVLLGELESDLLDSKIVHYGYHVNEEDEKLREVIKKAANSWGSTPMEQYNQLVKLVNRFYSNGDHIINITTSKE